MNWVQNGSIWEDSNQMRSTKRLLKDVGAYHQNVPSSAKRSGGIGTGFGVPSARIEASRGYVTLRYCAHGEREREKDY